MGAGDERNLLQQPHRLPSLQQAHDIDDAEEDEDEDMRNPTPELDKDIVESSPTTPMHCTRSWSLPAMAPCSSSMSCRGDASRIATLPSRQYYEMQQLAV